MIRKTTRSKITSLTPEHCLQIVCFHIHIYIYTRLNPPIYIGVQSRTAVRLNCRVVEHKSKRHVSAKSQLNLSYISVLEPKSQLNLSSGSSISALGANCQPKRQVGRAQGRICRLLHDFQGPKRQVGRLHLS